MRPSGRTAPAASRSTSISRPAARTGQCSTSCSRPRATRLTGSTTHCSDASQAYFVDVPRNRPVDVLIDTLEMCHRFDFGDRLQYATPTLPLAELLLSKLQVVKINRKDVLDALVLLAEHELGADDGSAVSGEGYGKINVPRILEITSNDWGWWRTVTGNLRQARPVHRHGDDPRGSRCRRGSGALRRAGAGSRAPSGDRRGTEIDALEDACPRRRACVVVLVAGGGRTRPMIPTRPRLAADLTSAEY